LKEKIIGQPFVHRLYFVSKSGLLEAHSPIGVVRTKESRYNPICQRV